MRVFLNCAVAALVTAAFASSSLPLGPTLHSDAIAAANLLAGYTFDEGSGTVLGDVSGNSLNGAITGATWTQGRDGSALNFSGSGNYVTVGKPASLGLTGTLTVCAWVNLRSVPNDSEAVVLANSAFGTYASQYSFEIEEDRSVGLYWSSGGSYYYLTTSGNAVSFNTWTNICAVRLSSSAGTIYVNGAAMATTVKGGPIPSSSSVGNTVIGRAGDNAWSYFDGYIDELRVYNRALTANEIELEIGAGPSTPDITAPVLSAASPSGVLSAGTTSSTLLVRTNEPATCRYGDAEGVPYSSMGGAFSTTDATSHTAPISGLIDGTTYTLYVKCQDTAGNSNANDFVIVFVVAAQGSGDTIAPSAALNLSAGATSPTQVTLSWDASTDNVGVTGYHVYRTASRVGSTATLSYVNRDLTPGTTYTYQVTAVDAAGNESPKSLAVTVTTPSVPTQTTLYVAPYGSDSNSGTSEFPLRTLDKARTVVRGINRNMTSDIVIYFRGGEYPISSTVQFDPGDSGSNGFNVIYKAYPGERPVMTGGERIEGWSAVGGGIYKAPVGNLRFRQLYVNGTRAIRARTPNSGYNRITSWNGNARTVGVSSSQIANWKNFKEVEMVHLKIMSQMVMRLSSYSVSGSTANIVLAEPERTRTFSTQDYPYGEAGQPYYFENALEFLDTPGEWYLDTTSSELFYMPRPGEEMSSIEAVVPQTDTLIKLEGTLDSGVHNIHFVGITFEHTSWMLPSTEGYIDDGPGLALTQRLFQNELQGNPGTRPPGAVRLDYAANIRFERNIFQHLGAYGLELYIGDRDNSIVGNVFTDISGTAIAIDLNLVGNPSDSRMVCRRNLVQNNYITAVAKAFGVAIHSAFTDTTTVEHNEVSNTPYTGILVGWGWVDASNAATNNVVRYNHVFNTVNTVSDGGAIYTLSRQPGTLIAANYVHDIINKYPGGMANNGVFLDNGSNLITVRDNVFKNIPQGNIRTNGPGPNNTFINNDGSSSTTISGAGLEPAYRDIRPGTVPSPSQDTTPPTLAITSPSNGAKVAGAVTLSAAASDNLAVIGVQFRLDGANLGNEDTSTPYSTSWLTTGVSGGVHTLTAVARDAAGNSTVSAPITVEIAGPAAYFPTYYTIARGTLESGSIAAVAADDGMFLSVRSGGFGGVKSAIVDYEVSNVTSGISRLDYYVQAKSSTSSTTVVISAYNYVSRSWTPLRSSTFGTTEGSTAAALTTSASEYVSAQGRSLIRVQSSTASTHSISVDVVRLTVTP
jgi:hypothetical protein